MLNLGANRFTFFFGGGGVGWGGWFEKTNTCKCMCVRKIFLHKTIVTREILKMN